MIKATTIHTIISIATIRNKSMRQLDISTAFLHGFLSEDVYMEYPKGFLSKEKPLLAQAIYSDMV